MQAAIPHGHDQARVTDDQSTGEVDGAGAAECVRKGELTCAKMHSSFVRKGGWRSWPRSRRSTGATTPENLKIRNEDQARAGAPRLVFVAENERADGQARSRPAARGTARRC